MEVRNKSKLELTKNCGSIHKKKSTVSFQQNCRQRNCQLKTKKPYNQTITRLKVESGRVELPSKQATKRLSTRLFPD